MLSDCELDFGGSAPIPRREESIIISVEFGWRDHCWYFIVADSTSSLLFVEPSVVVITLVYLLCGSTRLQITHIIRLQLWHVEFLLGFILETISARRIQIRSRFSFFRLKLLLSEIVKLFRKISGNKLGLLGIVKSFKDTHFWAMCHNLPPREGVPSASNAVHSDYVLR